MSLLFSQYLSKAGVLDFPDEFVDHKMLETPRKSQITGLNRCLTQDKWGLYDAAGTGKTMILHATILYFIQWDNKCVAVMPPILFSQFLTNLYEKYPGSEEYVNAEVFNKSKSAREKVFERLQFGENINLLIMTYEMFVIEADRLKRLGFPVVITDEAHKLRGADSNFYSSVYKYTEDKDTVLVVATGTPLFHSPLDGFAMTNITARNTYKSMSSFKRLHCHIVSYQINTVVRGRRKRVTVEEIKDYKNLDTLHVNLYKKARRVEKSDVLSLKEPTIIRKEIDMSPAHKKIYRTMANERMLEIGEDKIITARQAVQLREHLMQIACNPEKYSNGKKVQDALFMMLEEIMAEVLYESKLIVYAHHHVTLEGLYKKLEDTNPALVYGGSLRSSASNAKDLKRFLTEPECTTLLAHYDSAGVGLDLQGVSHYMVMYEPTSIQGRFSQAMDRIYRGGQKNAIVVYLLELLGTVYPKMIDVMLDNSDRAGIVNGDTSTFNQWMYGDESR